MAVTYQKGDTVVVEVYGNRRVGTIVEKSKTVKGFRYLVNTEDGREHEDVYVDSNDVTVYIDSRLTKSFVNHQNQTNKLLDDAIDIANNI
jgi:Fe-S cluster assembly iron-binding protein IscA